MHIYPLTQTTSTTNAKSANSVVCDVHRHYYSSV